MSAEPPPAILVHQRRKLFMEGAEICPILPLGLCACPLRHTAPGTQSPAGIGHPLSGLAAQCCSVRAKEQESPGQDGQDPGQPAEIPQGLEGEPPQPGGVLLPVGLVGHRPGVVQKLLPLIQHGAPPARWAERRPAVAPTAARACPGPPHTVLRSQASQSCPAAPGTF